MGANHSEYKRDNLKLEGNVAYSNLSKGTLKTRWLVLNNNELSYSYAPGLVVQNTTLLDKSFHIFEEDSERMSISVQCIDSRNLQKYWAFVWNNLDEFNIWTQRIKHALRPVWDDPITTKICKECARPFNVLRRQHHCRRCGRAVCGRHSEYRVLLPDMAYYEHVRICNACFNRTAPDGSRPYISNALVRSTSVSALIINS